MPSAESSISACCWHNSCVSLGPQQHQVGMERGVLCHWESSFPECSCVPLLIAATGDDVSSQCWRVGVRRRKGMLA